MSVMDPSCSTMSVCQSSYTQEVVMQLVSFRIDERSLQGLDLLVREGETRSQLICKAVRDYVNEHLYDNRVIKMNSDAFDEFMNSLDAPLTQEEVEGRQRLFNTKYPWDEQP